MRTSTRISSMERLVSLLVVFSLASSAEGVVLDIQYPVEGNYSFVSLTCVGEFGDPLDGDQRPAVFLRNGSDLNNGSSELVSVMMVTEDSISFFFDQTQEGEFSCRTALGEESSPEQLAASPPPGYTTIEMVHYIILPSPESNRSIVLSCAIRPGALAGRYSVVWEQVDQNNNSFINENKPDILVDVDSTATTPSQYQCNVTIQHNSVTSVSYTPPPVIVHYKVLSTLANVTIGEPATFYCSILKRDTDFNITWKIDNNEEYICDRYSTDSSDSNIFCSFNDSLSVLHTGSLGTGTHTVQCVLQQIIPENFTSDDSFLAEFGDNFVILTVTYATSAGGSGSSQRTPSTSLIVGASVGVLGLGIMLMLTAGLFILRFHYKRTHSKVKLRRKPEYEEGVPPEPRISLNKQLDARHSPLLLRQMANTPHFDGTRRQFYSSDYQGEDNGNMTLEEDPSQLDKSESIVRDMGERRVSQHSSSSSLRTASHQMMASPDNTDDSASINQDNADVSPNETAPAINCGECPIPEFMTPITTLSDVTSDGVRYENAAHDFTLEVPERAVPETERLTLDVAVALFGPLQFPEGLRPVSPVFWVCVRDQRNFFFSRPVSVTLPHFLDLDSEEDVKSLGLTFLKASHSKNSEGMYKFSKTDGEVDFECSRRFGVLKTSHFCSLCIASKDRPECLEMTQFCLTSLVPRSTVSVGKKQHAFFFVTFYNLSTCLTKVNKFIKKKKLGDYEKKHEQFYFKKVLRKPVLDMIITQPKHGKIGVSGKKNVFRSDVDFFVRKRTAVKEMEAQEDEDFYPPRFEVFLVSSPKDPTLSDGSIRFKGADRDLQYDIYLDLPDPDTGPSAPPPCPTSLPLVSGTKLGEDDLGKVIEKLTEAGMAVRWRYIGLALGLRGHQLDLIQSNNRTTEGCLTAMASEWLKQTEHGVPSLERLSEAVSKPAGGNNPSAAEEILDNWTKRTVSS